MIGGGGQVGEELGVAGEGEAGGIERRLGDGRGDDARDLAGQGQAGRGFDPPDDRPGGSALPETTGAGSGMSSTGIAR